MADNLVGDQAHAAAALYSGVLLGMGAAYFTLNWYAARAGLHADHVPPGAVPRLVRRWRFLIAGAQSEDDARALAERIRAEAPAGAEVDAEGSEALVWAREHRPFAVFGGLGL